MPRTPRYYEQYNRSTDWILRCQDCRRLVSLDSLTRHGGCGCGNKRVVEVTTLSFWEWLGIHLGLLRFPHRREFIREFSVTR